MNSILDEKINDNPNNYQPCYNCEAMNCTKVTYAWWGGFLGPRLLNHVKCNSCGTHYNGKTGKSNTATIIIYTLILLGLAFAVLIFSIKI